MVVMPTKVCTMSSSTTDQRTLNNLSMELSMLHIHQQPGHPNGLSHHISDGYEDSVYLHNDYIQQDHVFGNKAHSNIQNDMGFDENMSMLQNRKSINMTETVPVPTSEHVAEIVGRQGCKIKSLRAKTNTYIKTPVRGAEPVFVVTGRKEDVAQAKREILSAADHFSQIRASRRSGSSQTSNSGSASPTSMPGHTTKEVRVPYQLVGLVVGPKGATIKRIQQTTSTYIVTPGRDKEPVFEVTGLPENVEKAKDEIEHHISSRTGSDNNSDLHIDNFHIGMESGYDKSKESSNNGHNFHGFNGIINMNDNLPPLSSIVNKSNPFPIATSQCTPQCNTTISYGSVKNFNGEQGPYNPFQGQFGSFNQVADIDEGLGASGMNLFDPSSIWSDSCYMPQTQRSNSLSVHHLPPGEDGPHPRTRRTNSDPLATALQQATFSRSPTSSHGTNSPSVANRRSGSPVVACMMCRSQANACLLPCQHSSFCLPCAKEICQREQERRRCPICGVAPQRAVRL